MPAYKEKIRRKNSLKREKEKERRGSKKEAVDLSPMTKDFKFVFTFLSSSFSSFPFSHHNFLFSETKPKCWCLPAEESPSG